MVKVTLFMASSLNGIIARDNHAEDFLSNENWRTFVSLAEKTGCIIIGRKTYETVKNWKEYNFDTINLRKKIIVSTNNIKTDESYITAKSPQEAIKMAESLKIKEVLLSGGGQLNASFLKSNIIDEIIINIEPTIIGKGIELFGRGKFESRLKLISINKLRADITQLVYKVIK